jgi:hypothetical protein
MNYEMCKSSEEIDKLVLTAHHQHYKTDYCCPTNSFVIALG